MRTYRFPAYVIRDGEGWAAVCPGYPDGRARGATREGALANLRDLVRILVEDGLGDDEAPPQPDWIHIRGDGGPENFTFMASAARDPSPIRKVVNRGGLG